MSSDGSGVTPSAGVGRGRRAAGVLAWLYLSCTAWLVGYAVLATVAFGWQPIVIDGGSMTPRIRSGDVVMLGEPDGPVAPGAVLTFRADGRPDRLVTHRVVAVLPEGYRTRGDANRTADSAVVAHGDVVGTARLLVPLVGRPLVWWRHLQVPSLLLLAAGTAAALALAGAGREGVPAPAPAVAPAPARRPWAAPRPAALAHRVRLVLPVAPAPTGRQLAWAAYGLTVVLLGALAGAGALPGVDTWVASAGGALGSAR